MNFWLTLLKVMYFKREDEEGHRGPNACIKGAALDRKNWLGLQGI